MAKYTVAYLTTEVNNQREHARRLATVADKYRRIAIEQTKRALAAEVQLAQLANREGAIYG